jgi:hypothetical protein
MKHITPRRVAIVIFVLHMLASFIYMVAMIGPLDSVTPNLAVRWFFFFHWFPWTLAELFFGELGPPILMFFCSAIFWAFVWSWCFRRLKKRFLDDSHVA